MLPHRIPGLFLLYEHEAKATSNDENDQDEVLRAARANLHNGAGGPKHVYIVIQLHELQRNEGLTMHIITKQRSCIQPEGVRRTHISHREMENAFILNSHDFWRKSNQTHGTLLETADSANPFDVKELRYQKTWELMIPKRPFGSINSFY